MCSVVWIDEDLDEFPAIERMIQRMGHVLVPARSVREGMERVKELLEQKQRLVVLLDVLSPTGEFAVEQGAAIVDVEGLPIGFSGMALLKRFPEIVDRTIVLSVVPHEMIEAAVRHFVWGRRITVFEKAWLRSRLRDLGAKIDELSSADAAAAPAV